jgi:hypothetical protein
MSSQLLGTFIGIEYIEKITNGMINISTANPFEYLKNITLSSYSLEKKNIKPILNNILENRPKDTKLKIEITGSSLKSYVSFYIFDYSTSTLELSGKKIDLITFQWNTLQNGEFINSYGRGREGELYTITWSYIDMNTNKPILISNNEYKKKDIKNKLLSDEDLMNRIKTEKESNINNRRNRRNRRNILLLLKVIAAILLFVTIMKFLK